LNHLSGYLTLAEQLCEGLAAERDWNFGPKATDRVTSGDVAKHVATAWGEQAGWPTDPATAFPHEATLLSFNAGDAKNLLKRRPKWPLTVAIKHISTWHHSWPAGYDMQTICRLQIAEYENDTMTLSEPKHALLPR
jgi:nucleoside-diphosphate-sugar epimerase